MPDKSYISEEEFANLIIGIDDESEQKIGAILNGIEEKVAATNSLMDNLAATTLKATDGFGQFALAATKGTDATDEAIKHLNDGLASASMEAMQLSESLQSALAEVSTSFYNSVGATQSEVDAINSLAEAFKNENVQAEIDKMVALEEATRAETAAANALKAQWDETLANNDQQAVGYGKTGGMIGPAEEGDDGGGGGGSLFGIAHGIRAASGLGRLAGMGAEGTNAFTGTADVLYMAQGLRQATSQFGELNAALEASGGLFPPLTDGLVGMGVPMAGLLSVVLPVGAALVGVGIEFAHVQKIISDGTDAIAKADDRLTQFFKLSADGTTESITKKRDEQQQIKDANDQTIAINEAEIKRQVELAGKRAQLSEDGIKNLQDQAVAATKPGSSGFGLDKFNLPVDAIPGIDALIGATQKLYDTSTKAQVGIDAANDALKQQSVAANDAAEATRHQIDAEVARQQQYASDDAMTADKARERLQYLKDDIPTQEAAILALQRSNGTLKEGSAQWAENTAAIKDHQETLNNDRAEIDHITNASLGLIQAHQDEKDALKAATEAAKEAQKEFDGLNKSLNAIPKQEQAAKDGYDKSVALAQIKEQEQITAVLVADTEARRKIYLDAFRKEQDLAQANSDAIVDIRQRETEKEQAALVTLNNQLADDQTKYDQDLAKLIRADQYAEQTDEMKHRQRMADLRQQDTYDETMAMLDGNFLKLYQDQFKQDHQLQQEEEHYQDEEALRHSHLQQQEQELAIALANTEQQQQVAYQRKIAADQVAMNNDLTRQQTNEDRKERALQLSEDRQFEDLNIAESNKLQLISANLNNEMQVYQYNFNLRMALLQQESIVLSTQIGQLMLQQVDGPPSIPDPTSTGSGNPVSEFGFGGNFNAGQAFTFNEPWSPNEKVDIGGMSFGANTAALVIPAQGGSVTPASSSKSITLSPVFQISGARDDMAIVGMAMDRMQTMLDEYTN